MGMDLCAKHLVLTENEYEKLKKKELYFKSKYDFTLITAEEAEKIKKVIFFDTIQYNLEKNTNFFDVVKDYNTSLYDFCDKILDKNELYCDVEELPISFESFYNAVEEGYVIKEVTEEKINGEKFFLLSYITFN